MYVLAGKVRERVGKGRGVIVRAVLAEHGSMVSWYSMVSWFNMVSWFSMVSWYSMFL